MEVTKENFEQVIEEIEDLIQTCDFFSIDEEMSGVMLPYCESFVDDLVSHRYNKFLQIVKTFHIIQFGLCLFHYNKNDPKEITARPYNFYIFPERGIISMDGNAIIFNKNHNMDFNKWIYHGINYTDKNGEENLLKKFNIQEEQEEEKKKISDLKKDRQRIIITTKDDLIYMEKIMIKLEEWLLNTNETEFLVQEGNSFQRRAVIERINEKYPDLICESRQIGNDCTWKRQVAVMRLSNKEKEKRNQQMKHDRTITLSSRIGARRIFEMMVKSKKLLVAHNCLLDLMFLLNHFDQPLPTNLKEFKYILHGHFNHIIDTKLLPRADIFFTIDDIGNHIPLFPSSHLNDLYQNVCENNQNDKSLSLILPPAFHRYQNICLHEAAYDALCTGFIYAYISKLPAFNQNLHLFKNIISLQRCLYNFNITASDGFRESGCIYYIYDYQPNFTNEQLLKIFQDFNVNPQIRRINQKSSFVICDWMDDEKIKKNLCQNNSTPPFNIMEIKDWVYKKKNEIKEKKKEKDQDKHSYQPQHRNSHHLNLIGPDQLSENDEFIF